MTMDEIEDMRDMTFSDLAFQVISKFISEEDIPSVALKDIVDRSFSSFRTEKVTPVKQMKNYWLMELFHGPTFAFKDVALQFLGNLFEFFLTRGDIQSSITILGATSGDTGSAAIHGLRGKNNVNCFILYPKGRVTEIQEKQMTSILDKNVHCISLDTDFDGCQATVKAAFADAAFRDEVHLGAINSINWARVLAQITYYFYGWLRVTDDSLSAYLPRINYVVPTGNFGDILAGYFAKRMGLPVDKLVVATNSNDVLHRFLETGRYERTACSATLAPSMDISVSSNFERYLYYVANQDTSVCHKWMSGFEETGALRVSKAQLESARADFASASCQSNFIISEMVKCWKEEKYLLCPHTATAAFATDKLKLSAVTTVCLATAHPAKFQEAVDQTMSACNDTAPRRPPELEILFRLPTRSTELATGLDAVQGYMRRSLRRDRSVVGSVFHHILSVGNWCDSQPLVSLTLVALGVAAATLHVTRRLRE